MKERGEMASLLSPKEILLVQIQPFLFIIGEMANWFATRFGIES